MSTDVDFGQAMRLGCWGYTAKGAMAPGSDADIAIIDPRIKRTVRKEDLNETDYTPWEGWKVPG